MSNVIYHWHHIIPRHAGGTDDPSNLIRLTITEHAEAHRLLWEQHGRIQDKLAWLMLSGKTEEAEAARIELTTSPEVRAKISASQKGKIRSKEHCENLSKALTGKKLSDEHKVKISNAHKGNRTSWDNRSEADRAAWIENIKHARKKKWEQIPFEVRQELSRKMNARQAEIKRLKARMNRIIAPSITIKVSKT